MTERKSSLLVPGLLLFTLVFVFYYPRLLIGHFGLESPWTNYLYMYGFGGYFFGIGLLLILKTKACVFGRGNDSKWFAILCIGFLLLVTLHGVWTYLAISLPFNEGVN